MKAIATCPKCLLEQSQEANQPPFNPIAGELDDSGIIHVNCDKGHYGVVLFNARRYQVLVRSAARAFLDGYTNEVVMVMSSALERAYEFYVRVSCHAKGINENSLNAAWKNISSQSERQFGAFQFLYLLDQNEAFKIEQSITETRNKIVHQGKIARESEAYDYAEKVYASIMHLETLLNSKFPSFVKEESEREVRIQESKIPAGVEHLKLSISTVNVDTSKNEVIGTVTKFIEYVAAIQQARERGFPT